MFRQACAIESAALRSGLEVMVVLTASKLELDDNTTCQLYMSGHTNLHFYTVNISSLALNTPLQSFLREAEYKEDWSALIGRGPTLLCSHWSRSSLVILAPAILCHKELARRFQSLLLATLERKIPPLGMGGIFLAPRWFSMS